MERSYRIKANVGLDQSLNINLKQDVDLYEVLSLKLKQENLYKLQYADYGVVVGRVLANDAFGVPNAKVSVFIPLSETDELRSEIKNIYPFKFVTDYDWMNVRFNTLPNYRKFDCHQEVGSFPNKQLVLDDDSVLEIFDKYYKYTTVTNKAGDYMIFGVPTGAQIIHVDIDLSDIGILSQKPRDFIYNGYTIDMFESPTQFKKSTNLDNLAQLYTENTTVNVYPLWGDKDTNEIAITRKDINIQYKFETTCVFIGSVVTDSGSNSISNNCIPDKFVGDASQLTPSKGNIEMIRKTIDDKVEEYPIKGNQLIDGDGTWCYQIPMNLDYVGMDEYGNIVPTDNPLKGIPTRARVRFRVTLDESGDDSLTRHKARYLIPNNPDLNESSIAPSVDKEILDKDDYYEFGTLTPDDCFRDLYWNKVYSVKSYIPRLQVSAHEKSENYLAIKGVNKRDAKDKNPFPFNKLNLNTSVPVYYLLEAIGKARSGIAGFWRFLKSYSVPYNIDAVREEIVEELDGIGLDFYNDWVNGCLYFPAWFWRIKQKKKYKKDESVYESDFCECGGKELDDKLFLYNNCSLVYENEDLVIRDRWNFNGDRDLYAPFNSMFTSITFGSGQFESGIIKKKRNKDGAEVFYYSFGNKIDEQGEQYRYARLFSTDIILLGSLEDCDIDGIPQVSYSLPSTTANIPPFGRYKTSDSNGDVEVPDYEEYEDNIISYNGMNWGQHWYDKGTDKEKGYKYKFGTGLFFSFNSHDATEGKDWPLALVGKSIGGLFSIPISMTNRIFAWGIFGPIFGKKRVDIVPFSDVKTCVNAERISELGVTLDADYKISYEGENGEKVELVSEMDGLITKHELEDIDSRALFATLNHNKLIGLKENNTTGYKTYNLTYFYPTNFDGRLEKTAPMYTQYETFDDRNIDYLDFRLGSNQQININTNRIVRTGNGNFGGKRNRNTTGGVTVTRSDNTDYYVDNGSIDFNKTIPARIRHFYGQDDYRRSMVYPVRGLVESGHYDYIFPLYNNSFYFYFGINQGSTAIDKFYEQFYSKCAVENTEPFMMSVEYSAATECNPLGGYIRINTQEIEMPYTIEVIRNGYTLTSKTNVEVYEVLFNNVPNGKYTVKVTDYFGTEMTEDIVIRYNRISLLAEVARGIQTEYRGQAKNVICDNDYYAELQIKSYNLYNIDYPITALERGDTPGVYKVADNVMFEITPKSMAEGETFDDFCCGEDVNIIRLCRPGTYIIKVYELCCNGSQCERSNNVTESSIKIPDVKALELYINNVPLKYIVGINEEQLPYNERFHNNGEQVEGVGDVSISGWFGVNNPSRYSNLFINPTANNNLEIWYAEDGVSTTLDIVERKFKYMFDLSAAAYVTRGGSNTFKARVDGGSGERLLRSASPNYQMFKDDNSEAAGGFQIFVTGENDEVKCHEASPNIVSCNYMKVDPNSGLPIAQFFSCGDNGFMAFNPKYKNTPHTAGNYFAGFSNNANIVQTGEDTCEQRDDYKPYQVVPYRAHDLYRDGVGMCLYSEITSDNVVSQVYQQHRYFRTEFIDRRFDYDFVYITGRKANHYNVDAQEKEDSWNMARISALTFNGIEMRYDENKNIISTNVHTEYRYNKNSAVVNLMGSNSKRWFYESKLYYDNGKEIELLDGYKSGFNENPTAKYIGGSCVHIDSDDKPYVSGNSMFSENNYPTLRRLDFYNVPYSEQYTFKNVSCSYDNIEIIKTTQSITAKAVPGEVVTHIVAGGELVRFVCNDFESDCTSQYYNVMFSGGSGESTTLYHTKINDLKFTIDTDSNSRFGEFGIKLCYDYTDDYDVNKVHKILDSAKTGCTTYTALTGTIASNVVTAISQSETVNDSSHIYDISRVGFSEFNFNFLNIVFDRDYLNTKKNSLMEKIKVLNTSTIINVDKFDFAYVEYKVVEDSFPIPTPPGPEPTPPDDQTNGDDNTNVTTDTNTTSSTGNDGEGQSSSIKRNYTEFTFSSPFLKNCMDNVCFRITVEDETANYMLTDSNVGIVRQQGNDKTIGIKWNRHTKLLKDPDDGTERTATIEVFMKIKNNFKAQYGEGYLIFAFKFKISKDSKNMEIIEF